MRRTFGGVLQVPKQRRRREKSSPVHQLSPGGSENLVHLGSPETVMITTLTLLRGRGMSEMGFHHAKNFTRYSEASTYPHHEELWAKAKTRHASRSCTDRILDFRL